MGRKRHKIKPIGRCARKARQALWDRLTAEPVPARTAVWSMSHPGWSNVGSTVDSEIFREEMAKDIRESIDKEVLKNLRRLLVSSNEIQQNS